MDQHRKFAKDRRATRSGLVQIVMSATKSWIKLLSLLLADNTTSPIDDMIRDLCMAKLLSNNAKIPKINKPKILINHSCKWIGNLNFGKIFNNELCKSKWPQDKNEKFLKPMTIYKYDKKTSTLFFNYRQTLENLNVSSWSNNKPDCQCSTSTFKDNHHEHVVTGNLNVIPDNDVRKILKMGTNFRTPKRRIKAKIIRQLEESLDNYVAKIAKADEGVHRYDNWKNTIINLVQNKLDSTDDVFVDNSYLISDSMKARILELQEKFVFTCIDKASKNYAVICKRFYIDTLLKEVGYGNNGNATYEEIDRRPADIINQLKRDVLKFGGKINDDMLMLPFIQITPKMHKNPIGFRTIISSKKCVTKELSKNIGKCLRLILGNLDKYCNTIAKATRVQPNWIIHNNKPITDTLAELGKCRKIKSVATFDFEQLYTNLKLEDIKVAMEDVIRIGIGYKRRFIKITNFRAFWSTSKLDKLTVSEEELTSMIDFLINNSYFILGDKIYRQKIGIPMGTDCAPFIANLFLFRHEFRYTMQLLKDGNYKDALKLTRVYRYIDDITVINDQNYLQENYKNIYPTSLNLKKVNVDNRGADILDISVKIDQNFTCLTSVYDKRDDFDFDIINFPDLRSNINQKMAYNVYKEEIRRYIKICNNSESLVDKCIQLENNLLKKEYSKRILFDNLANVINNTDMISKYGITATTFLFNYSLIT